MTVTGPSSALSSGDLRELSELIDVVDSRVVELASRTIILQRLVFSESVWRNINNDSARIYDKLTTIHPKIAWKEIKVAGEPVWKFVNRLNTSVHMTKRTQGGKKYRKQVVCCQGGEFCNLCGRRDNLQVDHIVSVNMGGPKDDIRNMQLLCERCNSGKSNVTDYDIRVALRVLDKECNQLRYRVLLDHGNKKGIGVMGFCEDEIEIGR